MSVRVCVCARPSRWVFCLFVYGDGDKNKHAETCCCRWRFVACSLATLLPASASSTSSCISSASASAAETSAKQNAPENPLCLSQWRKGGAVGACGVIAVHHLQQHLSANLFALVSIGAAAVAALFAFHSASVWTVCNRFPLVLLSMCATRGGASACDILYAIHIPPPLTHECRLRRCCCLRLQLGNASTLTSAGHMHIRHSEAEAGGVRCPPTNTNTTSPGRVSRGRALRFAQW